MYNDRIRGQRIIRWPPICRLRGRPFGYLAATASISTGLFMHKAISMKQTVKRSVKRASNTRHARHIEKKRVAGIYLSTASPAGLHLHSHFVAV